jgi:hypothetical protein
MLGQMADDWLRNAGEQDISQTDLMVESPLEVGHSQPG